MKTRASLVSNSSSSSFCVYGKSFDGAKQMFKSLKETNPEMFLAWVEYCKTKWEKGDSEAIVKERLRIFFDWDEFNWKYDELVWEFQQFLEEKDIEVEIYSGEEWVGIGRDYEKLKDDETGKEFRQTTKEWLKRIFGTDSASHICTIVCSG